MKGEQTRERIVSTALRLFHERGYANTSFADVAEASGLFKGNLAYYFKTKPELLAAVTGARQQALSLALSGEGDGDSQSSGTRDAAPWEVVERLLAYVEASAQDLARMGCPLGSLSTELGKSGGDDLHAPAAVLLTDLLEWLRTQFARACTAENAVGHAEHVLTCLQGAAVVAQASRDPGVVARQVNGLRQWLAREVFESDHTKSGVSASRSNLAAVRTPGRKRSKSQ